MHISCKQQSTSFKVLNCSKQRKIRVYEATKIWSGSGYPGIFFSPGISPGPGIFFQMGRVREFYFEKAGSGSGYFFRTKPGPGIFFQKLQL